jgi:metallo-beta-lactamase family protein
MAEAGRIKHHIKNNIQDAKNTILLVGYATPESLAGRLKRGDKEVVIFGEKLPVLAEVKAIEYYSAHADYKEMLQYLECQQKSKIKSVFLVHGEPEVLLTYKGILIGKGYANVEIPAFGDSFELTLP